MSSNKMVESNRAFHTYFSQVYFIFLTKAEKKAGKLSTNKMVGKTIEPAQEGESGLKWKHLTSQIK